MKKIIGVYRNQNMHWVGDGFPVHGMFGYSGPGVAQRSPFLMLAEEVPEARDHMGRFALAMAKQNDGSLVLLATERNLLTLNRASAEEVQEELMNKLKASDYIDYEDELAVKFQEAILTLPEKQRIVFNLRYYDELEYEDIARVLDSKVETLKVNYHYAKDKIKEYILNR